MVNAILTNDMIFKLTLMNLTNNLGMVKSATRQYEGDFIAGRGSSIRIENPVRYVGQNTNTITTFEDTVETQTTLFVDKVALVAPSFSQVELSRSVTNFNQTYAKPIGIRLGNLVAVELQNTLNLGVHNMVGSTAPLSGFNGVDDAKTRLQEMGVEWVDMYCGLSPKSMSGVRQGTLGLFTPSQNDKIIMRGSIGMYDDFEMFWDQTMAKHTTGTMPGSPVVAVGGVTDGSNIVNLTGFTASQIGVLTAGDVISFAGIYAVNPQSKQTLSNLAQFTVQSTVNSSAGAGTATITLDVPILFNSPYQNVSALPTAGTSITAFGVTTAGTFVSYMKNQAYTKTGVAVVAPQRVRNPGAVTSISETDTETGLAMCLNVAYTVQENINLYRFDIVYGTKVFGDYITGLAAAA